MQTVIWSRLVVALAAAALVSATADAKPRGNAGTKTRAEYCSEQYDACKKKGEEECALDQMNWDQSVYNTCASGVENACRSYFIGQTSPCNTLPRVSGIRGVYNPAIRASRASAPPKSQSPGTGTVPATQQ